jgi:hypothetical protein
MGRVDRGTTFWHTAGVVPARAARRTGCLSRQAAPLLAVLGVLVHLAGTVGAYLHFALVAHERCPVHGELIHARERGGDSEPGRASPARHDGAGAGPIVSRGDESPQDDHDVCAVTAALRSRAAAPQVDRGERAGLACVDGTAPAGEGPFLASRTGYRVAPKTSPPRA